MPQTILAVLGLMIAITLSVNANRRVAQSERDMISNEMEVMATGVALEAMERIRITAFDQKIVDNSDKEYEASEFSNTFQSFNCKALNMGTGTDTCDDLDDFNDPTGSYDRGSLSYVMNADGDSVTFDVGVRVRYVKEIAAGMVVASNPTYQKEVTVYVQDQAPAGASHFLENPIHLSRTFAYDFGATERGHGEGRSRDEDSQSGFEVDFGDIIRELVDNSSFASRFINQAQADERYNFNTTPLQNQIDKGHNESVNDWFDENPAAKNIARNVWDSGEWDSGERDSGERDSGERDSGERDSGERDD